MDNCSVQKTCGSHMGWKFSAVKKDLSPPRFCGFDSFCPVTDNPTGRGGSRGVTLAVPVM